MIPYSFHVILVSTAIVVRSSVELGVVVIRHRYVALIRAVRDTLVSHVLMLNPAVAFGESSFQRYMLGVDILTHQTEFSVSGV
jgi:hypothetical protein